MAKNYQISEKLLMALIQYHLLDIKNDCSINECIIKELSDKMSRIEKHDNYIKTFKRNNRTYDV